jgi:two-component system sensor histidine kinase KdpD
VSHELKTPVAIIRAALDGLPAANPMCQEIHTACQRLQRILDDFLDVTRVESASLSVQPEWIDLIDVVEAAKERAITDPTPSQQIITHGLDLLPPVRVDGRIIARALGNLIQNALSYGPVNEPIEISAQYLNGHLEISVEDRGPGIPSEHLESVFNKFFRLPGAPAGGTGLGLAIARGLLKTHKGNVHLKPRDAGGTVAILSVPTELFQDHALNHAASPDHRG